MNKRNEYLLQLLARLDRAVTITGQHNDDDGCARYDDLWQRLESACVHMPKEVLPRLPYIRGMKELVTECELALVEFDREYEGGL